MSDFKLFLTSDEVRTLKYAVNRALEMWPGSPQRPAIEQEHLQYLKQMLFAISLEILFEEDGKRSEDDSPR